MKIVVCQEIDSTMNGLSELLHAGLLADMDGVLAYRQTKGQGRLQRVWHTGQGDNLAVSFWVHLPVSCLPPLPLTVALAVLDALKKLGVQGVSCKWPNDIMVQGKKLGGILCRFEEDSHGEAGCNVGIGINIGMGSGALEEVGQPATSLQSCAGISVSPLALGEEVQRCLQYRKELLHNQGFELAMAAEWYACCAHAERPVTVNTGFGTTAGITRGVSPRGGLLIEGNDGVQEVICGDVACGGSSRK